MAQNRILGPYGSWNSRVVLSCSGCEYPCGRRLCFLRSSLVIGSYLNYGTRPNCYIGRQAQNLKVLAN
jgi:hypothetical protein